MDAELKAQELGKQLKELKDQWPYEERLKFALENGYNEGTLRKYYFTGKPVNNIPTAEKMLATINAYLSLVNV